MKTIPSSVYHLQINEQFPLKKVIGILPYLDHLGIEGIYCSPIFEATALHGYDIVNPNKINPLIGTFEEFETFVADLQARNMKLILDVVPNHMGIKGKANHWWQDVLENGPKSHFADFFDIDWDPLKRELKNKVLLPLLGNPYGLSILNQEIQLIWQGDSFWIRYDGYQLPLNAESYPFILEQELESPLAKDVAKDWFECLEISKTLQKEPENKEKLKKALKVHYERSPWIRKRFDQLLSFFNGKKGDDKSFDPLHELLERQYYRLACWLVAGQEINYRRFFNINELIAIHIEKEKVLQEHHRLVFDLLSQGKVQGLRIDHPDGLYDPREYFERLQIHKPSLVVIEKILDINETLPTTWKVQGTVGYEFLNILNGLFIQKNQERYFSKIYDKFIGHETDFDLLLYERKKWFIKMHMGSEVHTLGWYLQQLVETNRYYRDFTLVDLTHALEEIIACFPVYRTYIRPQESLSPKDKDYILQAVESAKLKTPEINPFIYDYIRDLFLGSLKNFSQEEMDFVMRFQQQTAPVMAKALEDSCFYIFNRFVALNEVGSNPKYFGVSKSDFHQFNIEKHSKWPLGFLPSSTQDTKWSEDARMRLCVLSEIPKRWESRVMEWEKENQKYKKKMQGLPFPDHNAEYYLYQMLLSVWPDTFEQSSSPEFFERVWTCYLKSLREAGIYTSWRQPNKEYEELAQAFLSSLFAPETPFFHSFTEFQKEISQYGRWNSLSSLILKIGSCGIVDVNQGNEWWQFCLMDPDNRRLVDYEFLKEAVKDKEEKGLKLQTTIKALQFRRSHKELFLEGEYLPLVIQKEHRENIIAFARKHEGKYAIVAAGRFFTQLPSPPTGRSCWGETEILLPKDLDVRELKDIFTDKIIPVHKKQGKLKISSSDCFQDFPFSILTN